MASFLSKLRTLTLGTANDFLDKAIDMNSIPVLKQHIRDLEDATSKLEHEAAATAARVNTILPNRINQINNDIAKAKKNAADLLAKGDDKNARIYANTIRDEQNMLTRANSELDAAKEQLANLDGTVSKLKERHQYIMARLHFLQTQQSETSVLTSSNKAISAAADLMNDGVDGGNIDNVATKISEDNAVAREEFKRTMGKFDGPPDPSKDAEVDDILNSLRPTVTTK